MNLSLNNTRFNSNAFPQYERLTFVERVFLRTCCYYPPKPRRRPTLEHVNHTDHYIATYERAFGPELWPWIAGREVLDLGCGEGGFVLALAEKGARHVTGLDILPNFQLAEDESRRRGFSVTFVNAAAETLPDARFDVVISHDSFEHFDEPEHTLAEMIRLTRPGGLVLIKFGPPWLNPWGRHMGRTIRKDRPWVHLIVPEKTVMRVHSVYHNETHLSEYYYQLPGGMNKMTVGRFRHMLQRHSGIHINDFHVFPIYGFRPLILIPGIQELFASGVRVVCRKEGTGL
jgi:ubiquinone/menaquinone biosynthesis C-methylase UbiE